MMIQFLIQIFDSDFVFDSDLDKDCLILMLILSLIWILNAGHQTIHCFSKALQEFRHVSLFLKKTIKKN